MNYVKIFNNVITKTKHLIQSKDYHVAYSMGNSFSRSRKLSFQQMIYYILKQSKNSLAANISAMKFDFPEMDFPFISRQALSKARQNISPEAIKELFRLSVNCFYSNIDKSALWNGYHIFAIDGSTLQIPFSKENMQEFGTNPNQYDMDSALASASICYDVMNDIVTDTKISPYRQDERAIACQHMDELLMLELKKPTILLMDRGYPSYDLFHKMINNNLFFLVRLPSSFKKLIHTEIEDCIINYQQRPKKELLKLRAVHFALPDGRIEYLATNLLQNSFTLEVFKELYFLRWGIMLISALFPLCLLFINADFL